MRRHWRGRLSTIAAIVIATLAPATSEAQPQAAPTGPAYSGTCPNGAPAKEERYCRFIHFNTNPAPLPTAVGDFLGVTSADQTRSIGLIIAIGDYPGMPGHNLSAAKIDGNLLEDFLLNNQRFDEVIVLRDADATVTNINYFLEDYLVNHADDYHGPDGHKTARLLIAYSGHGRAETPSVRAAFVLGAATDPNGSDGMYKMTDFTRDVKSLATHYLHVLTLVNACFGANVFIDGNTGAAASPTGQGSFIVTAGSPLNEVQALIPSRGSLFFDLVVNGITKGEADTQSQQSYLADGTGMVKAQGSLTLTLPLYSYLSGAFYKINSIQKKANPHFLTISEPFFGPVQDGMAQGAFFFLSNQPPSQQTTTITAYLKPIPPEEVQSASIGPTKLAGVASGEAIPVEAPSHTVSAHAVVVSPDHRPQLSPAAALTNDLPFGPISSLKGRPDLKIFKPPAIYPIKGYDLSAADGKIDWAAFAGDQASKPAFIYARAIGWAGSDKKFDDRWSHAAALGIDRGAYLKFNFCLSVDNQLEQLRKIVPSDMTILPIGIELVTPTADQQLGSAQVACYQQMGGAAQARDRVLQMAAAIKSQWHKTPLLMGNSYNLSVLIDDRADNYMIWIDAYGAQNTIGDRLKLRGRNPWTMWQYTRALNVAGIGPNTTGEVFFGTRTQYEAFRRGIENVALTAVQ